jgi:hypothetical protein
MFRQRRALVALTSTVIAYAVGCGIASADAPPTTPAAPAASSAPQSRVRGVPVIPVTKEKVSWQITPMQTYFTGSNINTNTTLANRVGFQFGYDLTNRITAFWNRTPNDSLQENPIGVKNQPSLDLIDEIGASYKVARNWTVAAESYRRWRQCCAGAGDPTNNNPAIMHGFGLLTNFAFGPDTIIGKPFSFTYQDTYFSHKTNNAAVANAGLKAIGVADEGNKWASSITLTYRIPVFHQRRFVPFVSLQELPTYFGSQVEPLYSNVVNYGANMVANKYLSFTLSARNLNERHEGYPLANGQLQHYSWLILAANFHGRI